MKRNIVWIVIDGVRNYQCPHDPERMGRPPVFDRLGAEAVYFENAITSAPSTMMSVTAMMTSIPAYYLSRNLDDLQLDRKHYESIGSILEGEGYSVYSVSFYYDMRRDYWREFLRPAGRKYWPRGLKRMTHWGNEPIGRVASTVLQGSPGMPFFLYVHYNARRDADCNNRVEELIDQLVDLDLYDDSVLVICSDHGMPDTERRDHYAWLREKGFYFNRHDLVMTDDNICVPLLIKYPGCSGGSRIGEPVGLIDITPTLLDLVQIPNGESHEYGRQFRGVSLVPLMSGEDAASFGDRKIRTDTRYISQRDRIISIRGARHKYVYHRDVPSDEKELFYDLAADPMETENVIDSDDPVVREAIADYRKEYQLQEDDSLAYQKTFLTDRFHRKLGSVLDGAIVDETRKVLLFGSANPGVLELYFDVISHGMHGCKIDVLLERANALSNEEMMAIGFRNIIFLPSRFDGGEFRMSYRDVLERYDICIVPLTDYATDMERSESKSTDGKMQTAQPQTPISNQMLRDYKEVFRVARQVNAGKTIYVSYNMDVVLYPRLFLVRRYFLRAMAKLDIYAARPFEMIRDVKGVFG